MQQMVKQLKPETLCQLHICKQSVTLSSSLYLFLFLRFCACISTQADMDLSLTGANQPSQHDHVPLARHMMPWGDLLSWLPPFPAEEEAAGDMLAGEETVQFLAGVICVCVLACVCGITA